MHLNEKLKAHKWEQNPHEPCLFKRGLNSFILIYVDDILIVAPKLDEVNAIKRELAELFPIKDLGAISEYLGVEVQRDRANKIFYLRQMGLIDSIIARATRATRVQSVPKSPYADIC